MMNSIVYALSCALAGLLSFLSPCVLPLIPSYLCIVGGTSSPAEAAGSEWKPKVIAGTVSFILGFSAVFIALSIVFSATFRFLGNAFRWINWIAGAAVIVLGLNIIFDFLAFLNYEKRFHFARRQRGIIGAFVTGAAFGAGWTPCVGPALAGVLLLASQSGGIPRAALYLACYSAGLGLPFLLASVFFSAFMKASAKLKSRLPLIRKASGVLLVAMGVLIVTGQYQKLSAVTAGWQANVSGVDSPMPGAPLARIPAAGGREGSAADRAIPADTIKALTAAGLQAASEGIDPIDFSLPLLDGTMQTLSDLTGSVVFLNFWATWCPPCRMEMPSMEELHQQLKDKDFIMLAVNGGETAAQVSGFMKENKFTFPVVLDTQNRVNRLYGVTGIPTTFILDKRGIIISRMVGAIDWNQPKIVAALEVLLGE